MVFFPIIKAISFTNYLELFFFSHLVLSLKLERLIKLKTDWHHLHFDVIYNQMTVNMRLCERGKKNILIALSFSLHLILRFVDAVSESNLLLFTLIFLFFCPCAHLIWIFTKIVKQIYTKSIEIKRIFDEVHFRCICHQDLFAFAIKTVFFNTFYISFKKNWVFTNLFFWHLITVKL